ncbi:TraR/DksA family transcriptional regulator [Sessilibacter sp. MAH2]
MRFKETRLILEKKLLQLDKRVSKIEADLSTLKSADSEEQAQERENDEVLERIYSESVDEIRKINLALERIDEGTYGFCQRCGKSIDPRRLAALPYATLCIACAPP